MKADARPYLILQRRADANATSVTRHRRRNGRSLLSQRPGFSASRSAGPEEERRVGPEMMRWSHVNVTIIRWRPCPSSGFRQVDYLRFRRRDRQDGTLARRQDGRELVDGHHPQVTNGKGTLLVLVRANEPLRALPTSSFQFADKSVNEVLSASLRVGVMRPP